MFLENPNYKFINHDIRNPIEINDSIDQIYNLARPASPPNYQKDPLYTLATCIFGAKNVVELATKTILKSTSFNIKSIWWAA